MTDVHDPNAVTDRRAWWTVAAAALLIALFAIQPAFVARDPNRQTEFAWEMYSKGAPRDEFVIDFGARTERVTVTDVQPRGLATVDYTEALPAFICRQEPDAVEVSAYRADLLLGTHTCSR